MLMVCALYRQATQKPSQDCPGYGEDEGSVQGQEEVEDWSLRLVLVLG